MRMRLSHLSVPRPARSDERGASLIIALVVMLVMAVLVSGVIAYATTSVKSLDAFRQKRTETYAGDGAIKSAINWVASDQTTGLDPALGLTQDPCLTNQSVTVHNQSEAVKVSCKADSGGDSGRPTDLGLLPPEALVLLSDRATENGPYNVRKCTGLWNAVNGLYSTGNGTYVSDALGVRPERGTWFTPRTGTASCSTPYTRTFGSFKVRGDMAAKSNTRVDNGALTVIPYNGTATKLYATSACSNNSTSTQCTAMANRPTYTGTQAYQSGTSHASDPARNAPNSPAATPIGKIGTTTVGDINGAYLPVGFGIDGRPTGSMPARTTAYDFNADTKVLTPLAACSGSTDTVVFLPGWYKTADTLNKYTSSAACKGATFWFAPDSGDDGKLLTGDDKTGAFYMDFRTGAATACGSTTDNALSATRWCIGGANDQSARVVVGTPLGWTPQGHGAAATDPAHFPTAASAGNAAAQSDCDSTRPGGQLIFGGESHVFVQDGSLEVCAGPYPTDSANHVSAGIWAAPSITEVGPSGPPRATNGTQKPAPNTGDTNDTNSVALPGAVTANNAALVDGNYSTFGWGSSCTIFSSSCGRLTAWVTVPMSAYQPPDGYKIQKVTARVGSYAQNDSCGSLTFFCSSSGDEPSRLETPSCGRVDFPKVDANQLTSNSGVQILQVADNTPKVVLYDDGATGGTSKNCIGVAANGTTLPAGTVDWNGHRWAGSCALFISCNGFAGWDGLNERFDGIVYQVTLAPAVGETGPMLLPQSGCIVAHPDYNDGAEEPDCALIKAVSSRSTDVGVVSDSTFASGRLSIKGTIYAPSSAIDIDDSDVAYPLATRGAVLRHLRVSGYGLRAGYDGVAIDRLDAKTTAGREVVLTACVDQPPVDPTVACGADDKVLTRARVRFDAPSGSNPSVATILWWSGDR